MRSFKLCMLTLAWGLHFNCRFDDRDFFLRSQVSQKKKLQICFLDACPLWFKRHMVATYITKKYAQHDLCDVGVCSREIICFWAVKYLGLVKELI